MPDFLNNFVDILLWTLWIFLFIAYLFVLFRIVMDIFRDKNLGGFAKAIWLIALLFLPLITALIYLIARGKGMGERAAAQAASTKREADEYIREVAGRSPAQEIRDARNLLAEDVITRDEFDRLKAAVLDRQSVR